jgi:hypothetical protein
MEPTPPPPPELAAHGLKDDAALAVHLKELSELVLDFDIEDIGFELPEIDFRIQSPDRGRFTRADVDDLLKSALVHYAERVGKLRRTLWTTRTSRMSFSPSRASPSPGPAISGCSAITGSIAARHWRGGLPLRG